ncbi:MAG: peptidoglycan editing factor PgeF [Campylobacteraceae bacterium]|jgi:YfiH family protein|nr:peptidoglycan editing factor PgeF [Campylobacteraceae bacterium]
MRGIFLHNNVKIIQSDKTSGVSNGKYESLNLGLHVEDNPSHVNKNREIFASFFGVNTSELCFMEQTHSNNAVLIKTNDTPAADALITQEKNLVLCIMIADCVPVILFDIKNSAIAAIHAGRKGTFSDIITNTINAMAYNFKTKTENIKAFIGASIKSCCYEVKNEVAKEAKEKFAFALEKRNERYFLNLQDIIKSQLSKNGVNDILQDDTCTCCDKRYFSYRRDGICGRFAVGVKLNC